jgi:hypothetical protein
MDKFEQEIRKERNQWHPNSMMTHLLQLLDEERAKVKEWESEEIQVIKMLDQQLRDKISSLESQLSQAKLLSDADQVYLKKMEAKLAIAEAVLSEECECDIEAGHICRFCDAEKRIAQLEEMSNEQKKEN